MASGEETGEESGWEEVEEADALAVVISWNFVQWIARALAYPHATAALLPNT